MCVYVRGVYMLRKCLSISIFLSFNFFKKRGFPNHYGDNNVTFLLRFINVVHYTNE